MLSNIILAAGAYMQDFQKTLIITDSSNLEVICSAKMSGLEFVVTVAVVRSELSAWNRHSVLLVQL